MDNSTLVTILWAVFGGVGAMGLSIIAWLMRRHISAMHDNTVALAVLSEKVMNLSIRLDRFEGINFRVEKAEKDITQAHNRIREMRGES